MAPSACRRSRTASAVPSVTLAWLAEREGGRSSWRALQKVRGIDQVGGREAFRERRVDGAQQIPPVLFMTPLPL